MTEENDWFRTADSKDSEKFKESKAKRDVYEVRLKKGESRKVVFVEDKYIAVWRHTIKKGPNSFETTTCRVKGCYLCAAKSDKVSNPQYIEYYDVLDLTPFETKDGEKREISRKPLGIRKTVQEKLARRRISAGGSLAGKVVMLTRDGDKSPSCGDDFEVVGEYDVKKIPDNLKPLDFKRLFAPLSVEDQKLLVSETRQASDDEEPVPKGIDEGEEIPF